MNKKLLFLFLLVAFLLVVFMNADADVIYDIPDFLQGQMTVI